MFETFDTCDGGVVKLANGDGLNILRKGRVKIKLHDSSVKILGNVRHDTNSNNMYMLIGSPVRRLNKGGACNYKKRVEFNY